MWQSPSPASLRTNPKSNMQTIFWTVLSLSSTLHAPRPSHCLDRQHHTIFIYFNHHKTNTHKVPSTLFVRSFVRSFEFPQLSTERLVRSPNLFFVIFCQVFILPQTTNKHSAQSCWLTFILQSCSFVPPLTQNSTMLGPAIAVAVGSRYLADREVRNLDIAIAGWMQVTKAMTTTTTTNQSFMKRAQLSQC